MDTTTSALAPSPAAKQMPVPTGATMAPPAAPPAVAPLTGPPSPRDLTDDWAICCSGGGIRSATYCLGGLQSLDEGGLLKHAKWILGVSGGSYIAASRALVAHNLGKDDGPRRAYARDTPKSRTCGTTPTTSRPM